MPQKRTLLVYTITVIAAGMCIEGLLCSLLFFTRASLIQLVLQLIQKPYLQSMLENSIITPGKFALLRGVCMVLLAIVPIVALILYRFRYKVVAGIRFMAYCVTSACASVKKVFTRNTSNGNLAFIILLIVITLKAFYYVGHFDLQYDEMWSYNYFTSRPFYLSFFTYNNYPLYELSTQLFKWLPFSMKVNLRLPCVLAGLGACVTIYAGIKNYTGHALTALAGMAVFACMPVTVFYMLYARGVIFELLFAAISVFCVLYMLKGVAVKKYAMLFAITNAAGLYSMPTHIYFMALQLLPATVYIVKYKTQLLKPFLLSNAAAAAAGFICYLPVVAGSGLSFIINAPPYPDYATRNIKGIIQYTQGTGRYFTGCPAGLIILLALTVLLVLVFNKGLRGYGLLLLSIILLALLPTLIYVIQGTAIPERAVAFTGISIPACFCLAFYAMRKSFTNYALSVALITIFIAGNVISHREEALNWSVPEDKKTIIVSNLLMQYHVTTCYDSATTSRFDYFYPALEYYYGMQHKYINLHTATENSMRYKAFNANDRYDCIIKNTKSDNATIPGYTSIYTDAEEGFSILLLKK